MTKTTGIVCTIGPATDTRQALLALAEAGMTVARLNGSHNTLEWHAETIALVRQTLPNTPILLDIAGRKIRTQQLAHEPVFAVGDEIVLTTEEGHDGTEKVPVSYAQLHEDLSVGDDVLADDGTLRFTVRAVSGRDIVCRAEVAGILRSRKGINVPFVRLRTALVGGGDRRMLDFAQSHEVDFVGISFVESAEHIRLIKDRLERKWPRIVAKVENQGGLDNMTEIVDAADAVMIDRGDLSVETSIAHTALYQKQIVDCCREHGTPVIVATEMLHSMIRSPSPTKAEVGDVTNAVLDGCTATMLSGETAVGEHPVGAVSIMRRISEAAVERLLEGEGGRRPLAETGTTVPHAMSDAIALICRALPVTKIIAITVSGYAARMIAAKQPRQQIIAVSNDPMAARSFNLLYGTEGVYLDIPFTKRSTDHIPLCLEALWKEGKVGSEDLVLVTSLAYPRSGNRMNLIETHHVEDLAKSLGWGPR